jgi:mono/diheme cytochrome c family protein/DNA-binding beta-propeller fold protein YncE
MMHRFAMLLAGALALASFSPFAAAAEPGDNPAATLFAEHCATCHGADRLGGTGPALLPESLVRLKKGAAGEVIAQGRPGTKMEGFAGKLTPEQVKLLAEYVYTPLPAVPQWGMAEIAQSRIVHVDPLSLPAKPVWDTDPLNLFTVVETGDHHVTILDGDRFEPLARFQSRFALHGGAKYSPDGRFVYLASRDGWVSMYDLYTLQMVAEVRAGFNTRNVAASHDGRYLAVGNMLPNTVVFLDAHDLTPIEVRPVTDTKGNPSRVSAVYTAPPRSSFVVALKDVPEMWEMPYGDRRDPVFNGFVHNYEKGMAEGLADQHRFPARRIKLDDILDDFFFDQSYRNVMGTSRDAGKGRVVNLVTGREIAQVELGGMPHLGSGITFEYQGRPAMATPHLKDGVVSIIDMKSWETIKRIPTLGPGFFMRSHENSPYAWVDVSLGKEKDAIQVIDLRTLEVVKTLRPAPGRTTAHAEFTRDGRYVLISVMEQQGELIVFDAATFEVVKRLPMNNPVGKYNVFNKINYSSGTSH